MILLLQLDQDATRHSAGHVNGHVRLPSGARSIYLQDIVSKVANNLYRASVDKNLYFLLV